MLTFSNIRNVTNQVSSIKEAYNATKSLTEIMDSFHRGNYDAAIFSDNPQSTKELDTIISKKNREFIHILFIKSKSIDTLQFWLKYATLPKDSLALGVHLGCNIIVLKYLKENGCLDKLTKEDKINLVARAARFKGEGLSYLEHEFNIESPNIDFKYIN